MPNTDVQRGALCQCESPWIHDIQLRDRPDGDFYKTVTFCGSCWWRILKLGENRPYSCPVTMRTCAIEAGSEILTSIFLRNSKIGLMISIICITRFSSSHPSIANVTSSQGVNGQFSNKAIVDSQGQFLLVNPAPGQVGSLGLRWIDG